MKLEEKEKFWGEINEVMQRIRMGADSNTLVKEMTDGQMMKKGKL